eukprot:TRINITY_DN3821_c0_g1_i4.p2 TRINITY_DN3821_c0_g1~~TRINITY_DN3821_c0_g1_i4.p2  ORF type:complete len:396 (-),score=78.89 TRINITY_DN3821_c0_g1_i4:201-1388(-)
MERDDLEEDEFDNYDTQGGKKRSQSDKPIGKKWQPGGSLNDYFFECCPRWTVGNCLSRLLTKVKHNPNNWITVQKFVKDSCKANLKNYFLQIRDSMNRGESMVMAEVAYLSFLQLAQGPQPLLRIAPPDMKPRTRAAAISEEGFAFKDYLVQVTKQGFEFMNAKMNTDGVPTKYDVQPPKKIKRDASHENPTGVAPGGRSLNGSGNPLMNSAGVVPGSGVSQSQQMPGIQQYLPYYYKVTEQEQEMCQNTFIYFKSTIDQILTTIHSYRVENDTLRKENLQLKYSNAALTDEIRLMKMHLFHFVSQIILGDGHPRPEDMGGSDHLISGVQVTEASQEYGVSMSDRKTDQQSAYGGVNVMYTSNGLTFLAQSQDTSQQSILQSSRPVAMDDSGGVQ